MVAVTTRPREHNRAGAGARVLSRSGSRAHRRSACACAWCERAHQTRRPCESRRATKVECAREPDPVEAFIAAGCCCRSCARPSCCRRRASTSRSAGRVPASTGVPAAAERAQARKSARGARRRRAGVEALGSRASSAPASPRVARAELRSWGRPLVEPYKRTVPGGGPSEAGNVPCGPSGAPVAVRKHGPIHVLA